MALISFLWRTAFAVLALTMLVLMQIEAWHGSKLAALESGAIALLCALCLLIERRYYR